MIPEQGSAARRSWRLARTASVAIPGIALGLALLAAPRPAYATDGAETGQELASVLATALQAVYDQYAGSAKPVPPDVKQALAAEYASELEHARYVVSKFAIDLLATIDRFQGTSLSSGLHAVTVDDLIVFSSAPSSSDLWMWAHELHHVRQYHERGSIYRFALWYVNDCEAVEQAADERANRVLGTSIRPPHCL